MSLDEDDGDDEDFFDDLEVKVGNLRKRDRKKTEKTRYHSSKSGPHENA